LETKKITFHVDETQTTKEDEGHHGRRLKVDIVASAFEKTKEKASAQGINIVSLCLNSMLLFSNKKRHSN
jgi:hypothetical protein